MVFGLIILLFGIALLLDVVGVIAFLSWGVVWSILIIIIGITLLARRPEAPWWHSFDRQTTQEWERWGKEFGTRLERGARTAGPSAKKHGDAFGKRLESNLRSQFESHARTKSPAKPRTSQKS